MKRTESVERWLDRQEDKRDFVVLLEMNGGACAKRQFSFLYSYGKQAEANWFRRANREGTGYWSAYWRNPAPSCREVGFGLFPERPDEALIRAQVMDSKKERELRSQSDGTALL